MFVRSVVIILFILILAVFFLQPRFRGGYKVRRGKGRSQRYLNIFGFSPELSAADVFLIKSLIDKFVGYNKLVVVVGNLKEFELDDDSIPFSRGIPLEKDKIYSLKGWHMFFGMPRDVSLLNGLRGFWKFQSNGNDGGVSFLGCQKENVPDLISKIAEIITCAPDEFITSEEAIIKAVGNSSSMFIFTIGADGDSLKVKFDAKESLEGVFADIDACIKSL